MKPDIHPEMHFVTAVCACGNEFQTYSTAKELRLEICNACHPFYTGKQKFVDTAGRVERFNRRYGTSQPEAEAEAEVVEAEAVEAEAVEAEA